MYTLSLFGPVSIEQGGQPLAGLRSRKALALLAYLAVHNNPLSRAHLAEIFWPEEAEDRGLANLRWVLNHLATLLPGALTIQRHAVGWGKGINCDLHSFVQNLERNTSASLAAAAELYRGEFMAGFVLDGAPEFELWLAGERERRLQEALQIISTLAHYAGAHGNTHMAIRYFRRWLDLAPWHEEAHQRLIYWLAATGQRSAALNQYQLCTELLAEELGVAPSAETTALYEEIRKQGTDGKPVTLPAPLPKSPLSILPFPPHNLPRQLVPLVGRDHELAYIAERLADPACAWLTLLGPGGIGKSSLAIEAAYVQLMHFADGVWLVPLAGIGSGELLPAAIAQALGVPLQVDTPQIGASQPNPTQLNSTQLNSTQLNNDLRTQLLAYLSDKQLLLLLDNFEHLLEAVDLLDAIIQQAPGVKLLLTSREFLHHHAEWILDVGGLVVPLEGESEDISRYSAVQLFIQSAHRTHAAYTLTTVDAPYVAQICRTLAGMPLGIKLAAAWVRTLSCATISAEITRNLDFAALTPHGLPDRHRSLRAVINSSWQRLTAEEQEVLAKLALFRRDFGAQGAEAVAGATVKVLARLVDKSLLQVNHTHANRYSMHELLCQFGLEKLAASEQLEETRQAHALFYSSWLAEQVAALTGPKPQATLRLIDIELDNIRAAWQWAVQNNAASALIAAAPALNLYHDYRTLLQEAFLLFQDATESLQKGHQTGQSQGNALMEIARAKLLGYYGLYLFRFNQSAEAERVLREGLALATRHGALPEQAYALYVLGYNASGLGKPERAEAELRAGLALAEATHDPFLIVKILYALGWFYSTQDRIDESLSTLQRALTLARELGDLRSEAHVLSYLGDVHLDVGDYAPAKEELEESLHLFESLDVQWGMAQAQFGLLQVAYALAEYGEAKRLCEQAIPLYEKMKAHSHSLSRIRQIYQEVKERGG